MVARAATITISLLLERHFGVFARATLPLNRQCVVFRAFVSNTIPTVYRTRWERTAPHYFLFTGIFYYYCFIIILHWSLSNLPISGYLPTFSKLTAFQKCPVLCAECQMAFHFASKRVREGDFFLWFLNVPSGARTIEPKALNIIILNFDSVTHCERTQAAGNRIEIYTTISKSTRMCRLSRVCRRGSIHLPSSSFVQNHLPSEGICHPLPFISTKLANGNDGLIATATLRAHLNVILY